jgi:NADH-quinone oxidoreductase subunit G
MMGLTGLEFNSSQDILEQMALIGTDGPLEFVPAKLLGNVGCIPSSEVAVMAAEPCVASIYQLDGLVRRSPSLQLTADAVTTATQEMTV